MGDEGNRGGATGCGLMGKTHKLGVACVVTRGAAFYIQEWIEHYRLMGATAFYLCDHHSCDGTMQIVQSYRDESLAAIAVTRSGVPKDNVDAATYDARVRVPFFESVLQSPAVRQHAEWVLCVDVDEFAVPVHAPDLIGVLDAHRDKGAVYVNRLAHGTSHVRCVPYRSTILETLVDHAPHDSPRNRTLRAFVQPDRFVRMVDPQWVLVTPSPQGTGGTFTDGTPRSDHVPSWSPWGPHGGVGGSMNAVVDDQLRINHYVTGDCLYFERFKVPLYERVLPAATAQEAIAQASTLSIARGDGSVARRLGPALRARIQRARDRHPRVCLIFHIAFQCDWNYYRPYLYNLRRSGVPYDMYVTMLHGLYTPEFVATLCAFHKGVGTVAGSDCRERPVEIVPMANRGLDTGAFLRAVYQIEQLGRSYEYLIKIHCKTSRSWSEWRESLVRAVVGSPQRVLECVSMMDREPHVGTIGVEHYIKNEGPKAEIDGMAAVLGQRAGAPNIFVGGTMFWARYHVMARALAGYDPRPLLASIYEGHPPYVRDREPHFIERILGNMITDVGHTIRGIKLENGIDVCPDAQLDAFIAKQMPLVPQEPLLDRHVAEMTGPERAVALAQQQQCGMPGKVCLPPTMHALRALETSYASLARTLNGDGYMHMHVVLAQCCMHVTILSNGHVPHSWSVAVGLARARAAGLGRVAHPWLAPRESPQPDIMMGELFNGIGIPSDHAMRIVDLSDSHPKNKHGVDSCRGGRAQLADMCRDAGLVVDTQSGNTATARAKETDMLVIDSWRVRGHITRELEQHQASVAWCIVVHGTTIDGDVGESVRARHSIDDKVTEYGYAHTEVEDGIWPAIRLFLAAHDDTWRLVHRWTWGRGLAILQRL